MSNKEGTTTQYSLCNLEIEARSGEPKVAFVVLLTTAPSPPKLCQSITNSSGQSQRQIWAASGNLSHKEEKSTYGASLDMARYSNHIFLDTIGDLVFGKSFDAPYSGGDAQAKEASREGIRLLGRAARCNYLVAALPVLADWGIEQWPPLGACIAVGNGIWR